MRIALVLCLLVAASVAGSFPIIDGNSHDRARTYAACDTLGIPAGPSGRSRTIYLVSGTAVGTDSVLNTWRNTGTAPTFRRIQGMRICNSDASGALLIVTVHRDGATSSMNRLFLWPYVWHWLPIEADSIVIKSATASASNIAYCAW